MKKAFFLLCLFINVALTTTSQTLILLSKGEIFKPPIDNMIVMDKYTFGSYQYTSDKYDTLKVEIQALDSILRLRDSTQTQLIKDYSYSLEVKDLEVNTYKNGFNDVKVQLNNSIEKTNQLQADYKKLEKKNKRVKRWRNFLWEQRLSPQVS